MKTIRPKDNKGSHQPFKKRRLAWVCVEQKGWQARSKNVLPCICVFCKKDKTITCRVSIKWRKEGLIKCSTIEAANLLQAANDNKNTGLLLGLLLQIQDKDWVAIKVQYHASCYKDFTLYLSKPSITQAITTEDSKYSEAYTIFCSTVKNQNNRYQGKMQAVY